MSIEIVIANMLALGIRAARALQAALRTPAVLAWSTHLVLVGATATLAIASTPERDKHRPHFDGIGHYLVSPFALWDGGWYIRIADHGYGSRPDASAFWPLYPFLLSLGAELTGLPAAVVGVILSNVFFLAALVVLYRIVHVDYGMAVADRTVWLMALWPVSFIFSAVYTESLFVLLAVGTFALARSGKWTGAALTAAAAVLTRNAGIVVVMCLGITVVQQRGWHPRAWWPQGIQVGTAGLALVPFAFHINRLWGDPFLPLRVQSEWDRYRSTPWHSLWSALQRTHHIYATGRHSCEIGWNRDALERCQDAFQLSAGSISDDLSFAIVFATIGLMPYAVWRLKFRDSAYLVLGFAFPLFNQARYDPLLAMSRYLIVVFPIFVVLALLVRWRISFTLLLIGCAALMCGLLYLFTLPYLVT